MHSFPPNALSGPLEYKEFLMRQTAVSQVKIATVCQACELLTSVKNRSIVINFKQQLGFANHKCDLDKL